MRDARSAFQWFPPEFRPESKGEFAKNESKSGTLARTVFSAKMRFELKISLAPFLNVYQAFLTEYTSTLIIYILTECYLIFNATLARLRISEVPPIFIAPDFSYSNNFFNKTIDCC